MTIPLESRAKARKLMVLGALAGFGLLILGTYLSVTIPWVVDGVTQTTRLRNPQSMPILLTFFCSMLVLWYSWLQYMQWSHDDLKERGPRSITDLSKIIKTRSMIATGSLIGVILIVLFAPVLGNVYDIGGPELPRSEDWKPFLYLIGGLILLSVACLVSVVNMSLERVARQGRV